MKEKNKKINLQLQIKRYINNININILKSSDEVDDIFELREI